MSSAGSYQAMLIELNTTHLRSTLTFTFEAEIIIYCSHWSASISTTIVIEGMIPTFYNKTILVF